MDNVKILSVNTGKMLSRKLQKCKQMSIFEVDEFPYSLNVSAGAIIFFEPDAPEFNLRFDILDSNGKELDEELYEFDSDFEKILTNESDMVGLEIWITPKNHIAQKPGLYTLRATVYREDGTTLDELSTRFYLMNSAEWSL